MFANNKKKMHKIHCTNRKKKNEFTIQSLICFRTKIFNDKLQNSELQQARQTPIPVFPSLVS